MSGFPPRVWLIAAAIYVICPLDLDFIPVLGWIDDVIVAYIGISKWRSGLRLQQQINMQARAVIEAEIPE